MDTQIGNVRNTALLIATLSSFLAPFMISAVNIALPSINRDFSVDAVTLGWISTAYLLAASMFIVPAGRLADIHGRKKIYTTGIIIYTWSALFLANASGAYEFIFFRLIEGIGASMIFSTGVAIITEVFPANERGRALGINVAATYLGLSIGPSLGGFLAQNYGWRSIFYVNLPIGVAAVTLILWKLRGMEWVGAAGEKFDYGGSLLYMCSLASLTYGLSVLPDLSGALAIAFCLVGLVVFVEYEKRVGNPALNLKVFDKNRVFILSNLAALINYAATFSVGFLLSLYLQYIKALPPDQAGLMLVTQPLIQALFSPIAGRLSDKVEPRIVASAGMVLTVIGLAFFAFLDENTNTTQVVFNLIILGLGFALFSSPNTNAVMGSVKSKYYGIASATLATMRLSGQMLSIGLAVTMFSIYIGRAQIIPENYHLFLSAVRSSFALFSFLCLLGVFASLSRGRVRAKHFLSSLTE